MLCVFTWQLCWIGRLFRDELKFSVSPCIMDKIHSRAMDKVGENAVTFGRCSLLHGHVQPRLALWCRGLVGYVGKAPFRNGPSYALQRYKGI